MLVSISCSTLIKRTIARNPMIIPKMIKITPSKFEISSAEKRGPFVIDLSRRRKRENFSTTNPKAMMDIAVLIHARNVLSLARWVLLFPT